MPSAYTYMSVPGNRVSAITEYSSNIEPGWLPNPFPDDGFFCYPHGGSCRVPPTLLAYGPEMLVGRTIETVVRPAGIIYYNGGTPGWICFCMTDEPSLSLIYAICGSQNEISVPETKQDEKVSWHIDAVELQPHLLSLEITDTQSQKRFAIVANKPLSADQHMGNLWFCGRANGRFWH